MHKDAQQEQFITDFTALMYAKGYRGRVNLLLEPSKRALPCRHLGECLEQFYVHRGQGQFKDGHFTFVTEVSEVICAFDVAMDATMGFQVQALKLGSKKGHPPLHYKGFYSHRQVPGAAQLSALFPKDRPWLKFGKGRFRP